MLQCTGHSLIQSLSSRLLARTQAFPSKFETDLDIIYENDPTSNESSFGETYTADQPPNSHANIETIKPAKSTYLGSLLSLGCDKRHDVAGLCSQASDIVLTDGNSRQGRRRNISEGKGSGRSIPDDSVSTSCGVLGCTLYEGEEGRDEAIEQASDAYIYNRQKAVDNHHLTLQKCQRLFASVGNLKVKALEAMCSMLRGNKAKSHAAAEEDSHGHSESVTIYLQMLDALENTRVRLDKYQIMLKRHAKKLQMLHQEQAAEEASQMLTALALASAWATNLPDIQSAGVSASTPVRAGKLNKERIDLLQAEIYGILFHLQTMKSLGRIVQGGEAA